MKNKLHFFANYEYEHQPLTSIWQTPYPAFNVELQGMRDVKLAGVRVDHELSSKTRLMGKVNHSDLFEPFGPGNSNHPSGTNSNEEHSTDVVGEFTQVLSNHALNDFRAGYASYGINQVSLTSWSNHWQAPNGITTDGPNITFRGFSTGRNNNLPRYRNQNVYTFHDDFTFNFDATGRHDLKTGGEYLHLAGQHPQLQPVRRGDHREQRSGAGQHRSRSFRTPSTPTPGPCRNSPGSPTNYQVGVSDSSAFLTPLPLWKYGAWAQDDWRLSSNLTLNLGLRYDLIWNSFAQNVVFPPFEQPDRPQDANNMQPRVGFAYQLNDRTVIRGGSGLYYNDILNTNVLWPQSPLTIAVIRVNNDGRRRLCGEPVQRAAADLRPGVAAVLLRQQRARVPAARPPGTGAHSGLRARHARLAELDRRRRTSSETSRRCRSTT